MRSPVRSPGPTETFRDRWTFPIVREMLGGASGSNGLQRLADPGADFVLLGEAAGGSAQGELEDRGGRGSRDALQEERVDGLG